MGKHFRYIISVFILVIAAAQMAIADPVDRRLVAAYSFNEGTGSTIADASGNGNTGTISNATWTTAGKFGKALVFNGIGARVDINDSASLHLTTGMTLEAWVNPSTASSAWRDVIYKGKDNYFLEGSSPSGGSPTGGVTTGTDSSSVDVGYGTSKLPTFTWTYLAVTYDGSTERLYVNGVEVASQCRRGRSRPRRIRCSLAPTASMGSTSGARSTRSAFTTWR